MTTRRVVLTVLLVATALAGTLAVIADLAQVGTFPMPEGTFRPALQIWLDLVGVAWAASGAVVVLARPRHVLGWLIATVGAVLQGGLAVEALRRAGWVEQTAAAHVLAFFTGALLFLACALLPLLYPTGRLPSPRWRPLALTIVLSTVVMMAQWLLSRFLVGWSWPFDDGAVGVAAWLPVTVYVVATLTGWVLTLGRIARSQPPERQQLVLLLVAVAVPLVIGSLGTSEAAAWGMAVAMMLLPVAITIGILRYRLLGIELVLRRGLLYAGLTGCVIAVHAILTWLGARNVEDSQLPAVVAAAVVAIGLLPLRTRLQHWIDLLLRGHSRDPLTAVADLGAAVESTEPSSRAQEVVGRVRQGVRASGTRVVDAQGTPVASAGLVDSSDPATIRVPLTVGGADIGLLEVGPRTPGEPFGREDVRLLTALAPHIAVALHTADLATALERERNQVVLARAAERDRLRHDLHDGLGPSLTGMALGLQAVDDALVKDPAQARVLVAVIRDELDRGIEEIRRILAHLRPTHLDSGGLVGALQLAFDHQPAPPSITIIGAAPDTLPGEVEEAAYRIAVEAVHNAVRHAHATDVTIEIGFSEQALMLTIRDDGIGLSTAAPEGVGLPGMRRRAAALGGTLQVSGERGTCVRLWVPLPTAVAP